MKSRKCDTRCSREIKRNVILGSLLKKLRSATAYWFLNQKSLTIVVDDDAFLLMVSTCLEILQNGFRFTNAKKLYNYTDHSQNQKHNDNADSDGEVINALATVNEHDDLQRLIDDFEFLRVTEVMSSYVVGTPAAMGRDLTAAQSHSVIEFLRDWLTRCLSTRTLSQCLQTLVSDKELLEYYYNGEAFLRQSNYATSLFICLSAIELNQYYLLTQLDPQLLQPHTLTRRTISHPNCSISSHKLITVFEENKGIKTKDDLSMMPNKQDTIFRRVKSLPCIQLLDQIEVNTTRRRCKTLTSSTAELPFKKRPPKVFKQQSSMQQRQTVKANINTTNSRPLSSYSTDELDAMPSTSAGSRRSHVSSTNSSTTTSSLASSVSLSNTSSTTSQQRRIQLINCDDIKIWTDQSFEKQQESTEKTDMPSDEKLKLPIRAKIQNRKPEKRLHSKNGGSPINNFFMNLFGTPPTFTSWSHNFTGDCDHNNADSCPDHIAILDTLLPINGKKLHKRNSQNLFQDGVSMLDYTTPIEATYQITTNSSNGSCSGSSSISINTNSSFQSHHSSAVPVDIVVTNASGTPHNASGTEESSSTPKRDSQSLAAFLQMSRFSHNNTDLEKENAHFRISEACISAIEHVKWTRQRQRQLQPLQQQPVSVTDNCNTPKFLLSKSCENIPYAEIGQRSAESVGLTLISKFKDMQLPKVSDLKWLVSEDDTPQKMLPLPTSYTNSNKSDSNNGGSESDVLIPSMTRGTKYWAPPRQQIIFTEHRIINRLEQLVKQNYRCAGCGMRVAKKYMHHFRYCTYLGKYLCTGCHRDQISAIPAKILQTWDFRCYPVSVFSYRLIEQMYTFPLFYVPDLNPTLYIKHKKLSVARHRRRQLKVVKSFIKSCRFATREQKYFEDVPDHITADPDLWSMSDFVDVQNKSMRNSIDELIAICEEHVFDCVLCNGRGFMCEYCRNEQVLYPWQSKTQRCTQCGACFHQHCWKSMTEVCCRCERLNMRHQNVVVDS